MDDDNDATTCGGDDATCGGDDATCGDNNNDDKQKTDADPPKDSK